MAGSHAPITGPVEAPTDIAFGCDPETMRKHYLVVDEVEITDRVIAKIQGSDSEKSGEINHADATNSVKRSEVGDKSGEI